MPVGAYVTHRVAAAHLLSGWGPVPVAVRARPPTPHMVGFIDADRDDVVEGARLGVEPTCAVLQVASSTYYAVLRTSWRKTHNSCSPAGLTRPHTALRPMTRYRS